jgi:hypothetical protein
VRQVGPELAPKWLKRIITGCAGLLACFQEGEVVRDVPGGDGELVIGVMRAGAGGKRREIGGGSRRKVEVGIRDRGVGSTDALIDS